MVLGGDIASSDTERHMRRPFHSRAYRPHPRDGRLFNRTDAGIELAFWNVFAFGPARRLRWNRL